METRLENVPIVQKTNKQTTTTTKHTHTHTHTQKGGGGRRKEQKYDRITRQKVEKWNRMTALRFQTEERHQTSPDSLRGCRIVS